MTVQCGNCKDDIDRDTSYQEGGKFFCNRQCYEYYLAKYKQSKRKFKSIRSI